jgi:hypothetical protein
MTASCWLRRASAERQDARERTIEKNGAISEKVEKAHWFTVTRVRAERGAHRNLTEINVFDAGVSFDFGSTSIMETL